MLEQQISKLQEYFSRPRFDGVQRLYSERQVAEQQGIIANDYTVAREAAEGFLISCETALKIIRQLPPSDPILPDRRLP